MGPKEKELRTKLGNIQTEIDGLEKKKNDEKREYTKDEIDMIDAKLGEQEKIMGEIKEIKRAEDVAARMKKNGEEIRQAGIVLEIHNNADEADYSMGEMLQDVVVATRRSIISPRLDMHQKRNLEIFRKESRATGLSEGIPADGGFLVGKDNATGLLTRAYDNTAVASRCAKMIISANSNGVKINGIDETSRANGSRYGGVRQYWIEEGNAPTASKPKFRQIELQLKKSAVLYYSTEELLQDAAALESDVQRCVGGEMDFALQEAIINGTGAGKPLGVMKAPCLVTVAKETGQAADTIIFENISKMWARLAPESRPNAVWLINQEDEPQLDALALAVGTGGVPVYMPAGGIADQPFGRLKGRPVIAIEQCAALGDLGDIILADFSQYQLADKGGVQVASSMHVEFLKDEMVFRFIYRVDGQPLWHSALTPYKGTASTVSPFVTLAERA